MRNGLLSAIGMSLVIGTGWLLVGQPSASDDALTARVSVTPSPVVVPPSIPPGSAPSVALDGSPALLPDTGDVTGSDVGATVRSVQPSPTSGASLRGPVPPPFEVPVSAEPEDLTGYRWPLSLARMTSFFAPRDSGFLIVDGAPIHQGLDTATFCGDQIRAAHEGTVLAAGRRFNQAMGFVEAPDAFEARIDRRGLRSLLPIVVVVDDGNGYRSVYVHLSEATVARGDRVRAGQVIGLEGDTGNSTGCHLHYELIRMDGPWVRVARQYVKDERYPAWQRERIDPLRVFSLDDRRAPTFVPGIEPPKLSPGLGRSVVRRR